jgi:hypothetical protein
MSFDSGESIKAVNVRSNTLVKENDGRGPGLWCAGVRDYVGFGFC